MQQNFSSTKLPTVGSSSALGGASAWSNPSRITADDGSSAEWGAFAGGQHSLITGSTFAFQQLPDSAIIDGIIVFIDGSQIGCYGDIQLSASGTTVKDIGVLNGSYGSATDLWGADSISLSDIASLSVGISASDVSGGDGIASIDYVSITVAWHIEVPNTAEDVPTRIAYKIYSRVGNYLGELPSVTSKFSFAQDINAAGSSMVITCGEFVKNEVTVSPLLDEAGDIITTEDDLPILTTDTDVLVALGNSPDEAIFKNGNRVKAWLYNQYYPNGKLEFSGQVNRVDFKYGGGDAAVMLTVYSDGIDLSNFIARGYPFSYTTDQSQTTANDRVSLIQNAFGQWTYWGQTFRTGAAQTNIGSISLMMDGIANVTVYLMDAPNGNVLGSVSKSVSEPPSTVVPFDFAQLIPVSASTDYFIAVTVANNNSIWLYYNTAGGYTNGERYRSDYSGGSGGGLFAPDSGDLYFITKSGLPTTTTTYTSDDPVSDMAHGILLDYNARGGVITERDFDATGLSLTYTFVVAFIQDAIKKILELCPTGYYSYIDLGTAEIDIKQTSTTPDFTMVRGRHINELNLGLSIEQVKNYLLLTGGEISPSVNLYRQYEDGASSARYGLRVAPKSDNRITLTATADAIGTTFIEENAEEIQETSLVVLNTAIDIALLTPGKTIGFKNFGNFIDEMVVQIVRREPNYSDGMSRLTLGRLPIRMSDEIQRMNRELLNEQTINNPAQPS